MKKILWARRNKKLEKSKRFNNQNKNK